MMEGLVIPIGHTSDQDDFENSQSFSRMISNSGKDSFTVQQ